MAHTQSFARALGFPKMLHYCVLPYETNSTFYNPLNLLFNRWTIDRWITVVKNR
jgi:hypothetical protein